MRADVMAGLVPAIHALPRSTQNVDARDKPGHDGHMEARADDSCVRGSAKHKKRENNPMHSSQALAIVTHFTT
ncbi:hypothetical protein GA0061098_1008162 [Bradyrhizobium shewense]|uniref:Uncharacterized protein n=1 Tax=Bradyrhizobium shewense TaxID=1761772 RepID=A0A1C3WLL4_9BRAD|nr:hypothetical protein GA0061098_1008162 [Bradyrhizobium shewense]